VVALLPPLLRFGKFGFAPRRRDHTDHLPLRISKDDGLGSVGDNAGLLFSQCDVRHCCLLSI
jgi:hypothetical protein